MTSFRTTFLFASLGLSIGFGVGCVIGGGVDEDSDGDGQCQFAMNCGDACGHSIQQGDECVCQDDYDWCDHTDPTNFACCPLGGGCIPDADHGYKEDGQCYCRVGYEFCSSDVTDFSCCPSGGSTSQGEDTGDSGGTGETGDEGGGGCEPGVEPDPADCTMDTEGFGWCTHDEAMGPECSTYYVCQGGTWTADTTTPDQSCQFDQMADFAYGCVDNGSSIDFVCGRGPGTACSGSASVCSDDDVIEECRFGKLSSDSCQRVCEEEGDGSGATFDFGACVDDGGEAVCACCDFDDPECGGGETGTSG